MKSILLTSTALVAFAGAAAAGGHTSVTFSGEAAAEYNTISGYSLTTELTAGMSAMLDNGLTASAEVTFDADATGDDQVTHGSVSLTGDNAGITFGTGLDGAVFKAVSDDYDIGQAAEEDLDGVVGYFMLGSAEVTISAPLTEGSADLSTDDVEVGITTDVNGWALGLGLTGAGEYAMTVAGAVAGADLSLGMASNDEWDVEVSYPFGPVTASFSTDEANAWTVGADYDNGAGITAGIEYNEDESWEISGGYAMNGTTVDVSFDSDEVITVGATHDMGNGLVVGAGVENAANDAYAFADMSLGGGASAFVEYAAVEMEEVGPSERDIAEGATVGLSFEF
jgi:hypothetical protein